LAESDILRALAITVQRLALEAPAVEVVVWVPIRLPLSTIMLRPAEHLAVVVALITKTTAELAATARVVVAAVTAELLIAALAVTA
ncbi:MAG: hypothetical protein VX811_04215, partial [Pseudomonadota bacterium]|nr:hypothetical protein [Pseudomonadota bacterium]